MKEVHALSDSGIMMDKYKSKYASYEKDNIECTNFNLNVDELNFNKIPESINGLLAAQVQAESEEEWTDIGNSVFRNDEKRFGYDENKDFTIVCVNNNENEQSISPPTPPIPPGDFLDLAVANVGSDNVSILLGNGTGSVGTATNFDTGDAPSSVAIGDYNGDTFLDLAVANLASDNLSILLGNGDGTFDAAVPYGAGDGPNSVVVGDFNGDTNQDLAVDNRDSSDVSILLGNGDGTFDTAVDFGTGNGPLDIAVGDFDSDGNLDLATANIGSGDVSILLGNGDGTFDTAVPYGAGTDPFSVAVGDFN